MTLKISRSQVSTQPNPTHQKLKNYDPTQPNPTQPNPTHGWIQPMTNSDLAYRPSPHWQEAQLSQVT